MDPGMLQRRLCDENRRWPGGDQTGLFEHTGWVQCQRLLGMWGGEHCHDFIEEKLFQVTGAGRKKLAELLFSPRKMEAAVREAREVTGKCRKWRRSRIR